MKINSYSFVYSGSCRDPLYAAAIQNPGNFWAVASGIHEDDANEVIHKLTVLAGSRCPSADEIGACAAECNALLSRNWTRVSLAGASFDGNRLNMFNIGNARILLFSRGYAVMHSDDHTEAYRRMEESGKQEPGEYDELRYMNESRMLLKALGDPTSNTLQFYEPYQPNCDDAFLICTDNFWRFISVVEMELDYRKAAGPEEWLKIMCRRVLMKGGSQLDNENFAACAAMIE